LNDRELVYSYILKVATENSERELSDSASNASNQTTSDMIYMLLVDITAPRHKNVQEALRRIVNHADFEDLGGLLFINRCIYTAINSLHLHNVLHDDLKRLVSRLSQAPDNAQNSDTRKLRRALKLYIGHDMYQRVLRQARLADEPKQGAKDKMSDLFAHYSFLYIAGAVSNDMGRDDQGKKHGELPELRLTEGIHRRKQERIYQTRRELSVYWERRRHGSAQPAVNPTRLTNEELDRGIKLYHTRRSNSFNDRARVFSRQTRPEGNMSQYRDDFMNYITHPLESLSLNHQRHLKERFTRSLRIREAGSGVTKTTIIQGFKKILDEMMFSATKDFQSLERYVCEISPCKYAAILLNLVLGCPMILYKLEERLTDLYIYHEDTAIESLSWLVKFLEYIHLALVMNFRYYAPNDKSDIPMSVIWTN
jgi:hypothetical protein